MAVYPAMDWLELDNGNVRLACGDCIEILPTMTGGGVDAVVTDPPYGTKKVQWDESVDPELFAQCIRVSAGYAVFFYSNTRLWHILSAIKAAGSDAWVAVWHKPNAMGFERRFAPQWVPVVIAYRGNPPFWGQDLFNCPIVPQKFDHPTPKPVGITQWAVEKSAAKGRSVLDPFMGSGTAGVACVRSGRKFLGIEKNPEYFDIAAKRIEQAIRERDEMLIR